MQTTLNKIPNRKSVWHRPEDAMAQNTVVVKSEAFMVFAMKIKITVFISMTEACNV